MVAVMNKDWQAACRLRRDMLNGDSPSSYWLFRRVARACAVFEAGKADSVASEPCVAERLQAAFPQCDIRIRRVEELTGGLICFKIFRIQFHDAATGQAFDVVEKLYVKRGSKRSFSATGVLFSEIAHHRLRAPRHYGVYKRDLFASVFMDYVAGETAQRGTFSLKTFVEQLWGVEATPKLLASKLRRKNVMEKHWSESGLEEVARNVPPGSPGRAVIDRIDPSEIADVVTSSRWFVMHGDLHWNNVIIPNGNGREFLVIDWDKWCLAPIGLGLDFRSEDFERYKTSLRSRYRGKAESLFGETIFLNIAVGCACFRMHKKRWNEAASWLPEILRLRQLLG